MIRNISLDEDIQIKRLAETPLDQKPRFDWAATLNGDRVRRSDIIIASPSEEREFDLGDVAETIGLALTDLLLSREHEASAIFSEENRGFVSGIARRVGEKLITNLREGKEMRLSERDLYMLIEKALIESDAHDVARALVIAHSEDAARPNDDDLDAPATANVRLIRRNRQVVPWNESKIEVAVRKAFLALHLDSEPAVSVARSVTDRVVRQGTSFIDIETVQDVVQEELMRLGHFKVAEAYILYRARRKSEREAAGDSPTDLAGQDSMIVVKTADGSSYFWDGVDLRKRIAFASIGLDLDLSADQIEQELRRSLYPEMTFADLNKTIILNAKALIERDADFAKFAGRVLLTFIYEEVLDWKIENDGIDSLKEAHVRALKRNLKRGVEIERINPRLLE
ncbi:MAG: ATP cone domain-containing protein, partial [Verrucomicrobiota bacterium]